MNAKVFAKNEKMNRIIANMCMCMQMCIGVAQLNMRIISH